MKFCFISKFFFLLISISLQVSFGIDIVEDYCDKYDTDCKNFIQSGIIDETLNEFDQEDPRLIEGIRKRLLPIPSAGNIKDFSFN